MLYLLIFGSQTDNYDTYLPVKKYSVHRILECILTALDYSKPKEFAYVNFKFDENGRKFSKICCLGKG